MLKYVFAAAFAAGLLAAPVSLLTPAAEAAQSQKMEVHTKTKKPPTPAQVAFRARMKECGVEWRAAKAAEKIAKGMSWPKYWSACNKRLKAAAHR